MPLIQTPTPSFNKPEIADVYAFLRRHNALIVHFSGTPKGAGSNFDYLFPADLQSVTALGGMGGLSCSAVRSGDEFADLEKANATGCVGVVLGLQSKASLVAADPSDCGSRVEDGVRIVSTEKDLTISDLEETFTKRPSDGYNEWVIRDYIVCGIFAAPPFRVSTLEVPDYPDDMPDYLRNELCVPSFKLIDVCELPAAFPGFPIVSFRDGTLVRLTDSGFAPFDHTSLYELP